jgi:hypothetical protein
MLQSADAHVVVLEALTHVTRAVLSQVLLSLYVLCI